MVGKVRQVNCRTCGIHFITTDARKMSCTSKCAKLYAAQEQHLRRKRDFDYSDEEKNRSLKRLYGITLDDYNRMFAEQDGRCAICDTHQSDMKKRLAVDHCHTTKRVRKLLCEKCNRGLGFFQDSPELLKRAKEYLE